MPNHDTRDVFDLRVRLRALLQFDLSVRLDTTLAQSLCGRCLVVLDAPYDSNLLEDRAILHRSENDVVIRHAEVEQTEPGQTTLVNRRLDDTVDRGLVVSARHEIERIANVDDLYSGNRVNNKRYAHRI